MLAAAPVDPVGVGVGDQVLLPIPDARRAEPDEGRPFVGEAPVLQRLQGDPEPFGCLPTLQLRHGDFHKLISTSLTASRPRAIVLGPDVAKEHLAIAPVMYREMDMRLWLVKAETDPVAPE